MLLDETDPRFHLDEAEMDATHKTFMALLNQLDQADRAGFIERFPLLLSHTQTHFQSEEQRMRETGFPTTAEHVAEHQKILGELNRFANKVARGSTPFARAYVRDRLPEWFSLHTATMDSALAAHLRNRPAEQ